MSEEFNVTAKFKSDNEEVLEFIRSLDAIFQDASYKRMDETFKNCPIDLYSEEVKKLIPKKFKNSLSYALAETATDCEPNLLAGENLELSALEKNSRGFYEISSYGMDYDGLLFCKYLVTLLLCLGVVDLSAEAHGAGWEAEWTVKNQKLKMKKSEYEL